MVMMRLQQHGSTSRLPARSVISCDQMDSGTTEYDEGKNINFKSEDDNGTKVCFAATDVSGNTSYKYSSIMRGIDTTPPSITVTNPDVTVAASKKKVSATDEEEASTWVYQQVSGDATCDDDTLTATKTYAKGTDLPFTKESDNGTKVCFIATDAVGNKAVDNSVVLANISEQASNINITVDKWIDPNQGDDPTIPRVQSKVVAASDGSDAPTEWFYKQIAGDAVCDASVRTDATTYKEGSPITLRNETDNGTKICFITVDEDGTVTANASEIIAGIDTTAPDIITNDLTTDPAKKKVVNARDEDDDEETTWKYKQIASDASCNKGQMSNNTKSYEEETDIPFEKESDNNTKVCFSVTDSANNTIYGTSDIIVGIDTTPPSITVTNPDVTVAASKKKVSATDEEEASTWVYQQVSGDATCDDDTLTATKTYAKGTDLPFTKESDNGTKVCFIATDAVGNKAVDNSVVLANISEQASNINITVDKWIDPNQGDDPTIPRVQSKVVAASDGSDAPTEWFYKQIAGDAVCDASVRTDATTYKEGSPITLRNETDNGTKICFITVDEDGTVTANASEIIAGIDTTKPSIIISDLTNEPADKKMVSATLGEVEATDVTWKYKQIEEGENCNEVQMNTNAIEYNVGDKLEFESSDDNGTKICFSATDDAGNTNYAASKVLRGIAAKITVTVGKKIDPAKQDDPTVPRVQAKVVSADDGLDTVTEWFYKQIPGDTVCNAAVRNTDGIQSYNEGSSITMRNETDNGTKICFISVDAAGVVLTAESEVIAGIDTTKPSIIISDLTNEPADKKMVSATLGEVEATDVTWKYKQIAEGENCNEVQMNTNAIEYNAGDKLEFESSDDNGTKICFSATDSANNTAYAASKVLRGIATSITVTVGKKIDPAKQDDPTVPRVQAKVVSADDGLDTVTEWFYKQIPGDTVCNAAVKNTSGVQPYNEGSSITMRNDTDNGTKICFISVDAAGVVLTAESEVIVGIDATAPNIVISELTSEPARKKVVSAKDTETNDDIVWASKQIASDADCDASQMTTNALPYAETTELEFTKESDNGTKVCFSATDTANNTSHKASDIITGIDTTVPAVASATLINVKRTQTKVVITDKVRSFGNFSASNFKIEIDGVDYPVRKVSGFEQSMDASETSFVLTHPAIVATASATLSYTADENGGIADAVGNNLESFTGQTIFDKAFVALSLDAKYDTGVKSDDGITNFGNNKNITLVATISDGSTYSDGDTVHLYKKGSARALKEVLISGGIVNAIDADGETAIEITVKKSVFAADTEDHPLHRVYS